MHRWTPLNERQLSLLARIAGGAEPVTSDSPELALTARALKAAGQFSAQSSALLRARRRRIDCHDLDGEVLTRPSDPAGERRVVTWSRHPPHGAAGDHQVRHDRTGDGLRMRGHSKAPSVRRRGQGHAVVVQLDR